MIIARLHKGSIADAMETATTFNNVRDMKKWFVEKYENAFSVEDVVVNDEVAHDGRIGWNTQYVCTKRFGNMQYVIPQCIGMCDLHYKAK